MATVGVVTLWQIIRIASDQSIDPWGGEWVAIATAALVLFWAVTDRLATSPGVVMLGAGRLSYSLYLVHLPVLTVICGAGFKLFPSSPAINLLIALFAGAVALVASELLYRVAEQRAIGWSKRIPRRSGRRDDGIEPAVAAD